MSPSNEDEDTIEFMPELYNKDEDTIEKITNHYSDPGELISKYQKLREDPIVSGTDYSEYFRLNGYFYDPISLAIWAHRVARKNNVELIIHRTRYSKPARHVKLHIRCAQYEECVAEPSVGGRKRKKRTGCEFELEGYGEQFNPKWILKVICGVHNHENECPIRAKRDQIVHEIPGEELEDTVEDTFYLNFNWGVNQVDDFIISFVEKVIYVLADGQSGYRAISVLLGYGEQEYIRVRREIVCELSTNEDIYEPANKGNYGSSIYTMYSLIYNVNFTSFDDCPDASRMKMPIIGLAIATRYKVALVCLNSSYPYTCLPMIATSPDDKPPTQIYTIALVGNYVPVWLCPNAPIPPPHGDWIIYHHSSVNGWDEPFKARMQHYTDCRRRELMRFSSAGRSS